MTRIGIFSGTFDPVHAGHVAFALRSIETADLDTVYFIPEAMPRRKSGVTHYAHRVAMLRLALRPYQKLQVLELPDKQFSMQKTVPRLRAKFGDASLHMLVGSDVLAMLSSEEAREQWPGYEQLLTQFKLVVGVRSELEQVAIQEMLVKLQPEGFTVETKRRHISSRSIRRAIMQGNQENDLFSSLEAYVRTNWLYVSPATNNS